MYSKSILQGLLGLGLEKAVPHKKIVLYISLDEIRFKYLTVNDNDLIKGIFDLGQITENLDFFSNISHGIRRLESTIF